MMNSDNYAFGSTDAANESIDQAKSDYNRCVRMWQALACAAVVWGFSRALTFAAILSLLMKVRVSYEVLIGIRIFATIVAYFLTAAAIAIFLVELISLPLWRSRASRIISTDPDFLAAKQEWKKSVLMCGLIAVVLMPIVVLFLLVPALILP